VNPRASPNLVERPRSAHEIAAVLNRLLDEARFAPPGTDQLRDALVQIAARFGEIVTARRRKPPDPRKPGPGPGADVYPRRGASRR